MKTFLTHTSVLALALSSSVVAAQSNAPAQPAGDTPAPSGSVTSAEQPNATGVAVAASDEGIGDIIVTAQRRSESLQRSALAISAVDAAALRNGNVSQPQDLTKLVPALQLAPLGGGGTQVTIRGVGNFAPFLYSEPAVAINYDGVYLARSAAPNGLFFDLERVEVLKGPQGTLYGRNATGGAVNVITAKPDLSGFHAGGEIQAGNYDLKRGSAMVNLVLGSSAALRVAGQVVDRNGYLSDGYLDDKGQAIRGQLLVLPVEALSINLEADYIHQGGKGPGGVFVPRGYLTPSDPYRGGSSPESLALLRGASLGISGGTNPNFLPPLGTDGYTDLDAWGTAATIVYDMDFASVTFQPAYRNTKNNFKHYVGGFPLVSRERSEQTTLELRLASPAGSAVKWVVGGYLFDDDSTLFADADQGVSRTITTATRLPVNSAAVFGQATVPVSDSFRITGGVRYTHEKKSQSGQNVGRLPPVPAGFPAPPIVFYNAACPAPATVDVAAGTCTGPFSGNIKFSRVTWKGGVEFDAGPASLVYASLESGFKAGGFYPSLAPNTFAPEKIYAATIGSKNRFADNRIQLNVELYYWKYNDKQVSHLGSIRPSGYTIITENAGKATIYGAEGDLIWRPTHDDRLNLNLQYSHTRYNEFQYTVPLLSAATPRAAVNCPQVITPNPTNGTRNALVNCAGRPLPQSPRLTLNASYQHSFDLSGRGNIDAIVGTRVQSSFFVGEEFLDGQRQKSSMISYASLTYRPANDRFSIGAYIDNIEDTAVKASSFIQPAIGVPVVVLRPPQTYGVRAAFNF